MSMALIVMEMSTCALLISQSDQLWMPHHMPAFTGVIPVGEEEGSLNSLHSHGNREEYRVSAGS